MYGQQEKKKNEEEGSSVYSRRIEKGSRKFRTDSSYPFFFCYTFCCSSFEVRQMASFDRNVFEA